MGQIVPWMLGMQEYEDTRAEEDSLRRLDWGCIPGKWIVEHAAHGFSRDLMQAHLSRQVGLRGTSYPAVRDNLYDLQHVYDRTCSPNIIIHVSKLGCRLLSTGGRARSSYTCMSLWICLAANLLVEHKQAAASNNTRAIRTNQLPRYLS